jgi:glutamyl-tRNA reductase
VTVQLLGLNYRTADTDLRGRLALADPDLRALLSDLALDIPEAVALSTCNRTELYAADSPDVTPILSARLASRSGVPLEEIRARSYTLQGQDAVRHLFGVAAGLDSLVLGEGQILGQVRQAWDSARAAGSAGPVLNTLFRYALQAGKEIRSQTVVARGATSVAHAAVELARKELGALAGRSVLVLGAGETGRLAALNLLSAGASTLTIANRTLARAEALAASLRGRAVPFERLGEALEQADMLITCSTSRDPLVTARMLSDAVRTRDTGRPLLVVDIAVPRNVERPTEEMAGLVLYDLDDIQRLCERNKHARSMAARRARRNIDEWGERFARWEREREAVPLITGLRARAEDVRQEELRSALRALPDLSEPERAAVEALSHSLLNRLMHQPLVWLREHSTEEQRRVLGEMWARGGGGRADEDPAAPD